MTAWHYRRAFVFCLVLVPVVCRGSHGAELRTWTDSTGKYKVEAEFVEILDGKVRLKDKDGKSLSLPLGKVSDEDRAYLKEEIKRRKEATADPNSPFNGGTGGASAPAEDSGAAPAAELDPAAQAAADAAFNQAAAAAGAQMAPGFGRRGRRGFQGGGFPGQEPQRKPLSDYKVGDKVEVGEFGRWQPAIVKGFDKEWGHVFVSTVGDDSMKEVRSDNDIRPYDPSRAVLDGGMNAVLASVNLTNIPRIIPLGDSDAKFAPDPAPTASIDWKPRPVALAQSAGFHESVVGVSFASTGVKAAVGHKGGAGVFDDQSRIEICDLKTGRIVGSLPGPSNMKLFAVSPSGQRLITASELENWRFGPLQLWEIGDKSLKLLKSWVVTPPDEHMGWAKIEWIGWADEAHVMTVADNGLTMWSVDPPKGVYQITGQGLSSPAFSPGGKQFAIGTDKGFSIHDAANGDLLARIAMEDRGFHRQVAFSPSGKYLAATAASTVEIYDIAAGKKVTEAYASESHSGDLAWLNEEDILVGGTNLIHLPSQMIVWTYKHSAESVVPLAGRIWYVMGGRGNEQAALLPFQLPHSAVKPVADSELVLKPGDQVSLEVEVSFNIQQGQNSSPPQEQLKEALTDAGFLLVENSNKRLVARAVPGQTHEVTYGDSMRRFNSETQKVSVTPRVFELELLVDGQSVWKRSRTIDAPSGFMLQKGESLEQAIERIMSADNGFFRTTVPSRLLPTAAEQARTSTLSMNGIE